MVASITKAVVYVRRFEVESRWGIRHGGVGRGFVFRRFFLVEMAG